jgi:hypothetical protein
VGEAVTWEEWAHDHPCPLLDSIPEHYIHRTDTRQAAEKLAENEELFSEVSTVVVRYADCFYVIWND